MHGRLILTVTALVLFAFGGVALFAAEEVAQALAGSSSGGVAVLAQAAAAGLLGFAMLDWMSRGNRIGGVYGRPLALGNLLLFTVLAISVGRAVAGGALREAFWMPTAAFGTLALSFAWLAFAHDPLPRADVSAR